MKANRFFAIIALFLIVLLGNNQAFANATLLPNGQQCFSATTGTNGMVGTLGAITGGAGGTAGTYGGVALTGGSGLSATANITVAGGAVTAVTILNPGTQYIVGDTLSAAPANIGGVVGFSVPVASVAINSALAGGTVGFYIPSTLTPKQTWKDAGQTILNTNPVTLDSNGCAVIYGTGSYRQIVKDSLGNTVWDQVTADTSSYNNVFWAGTAGGTPNAITVVDPGFNATDGSIIGFIPIATNTGSATLNPSSFGNVPIVKDTTGGAVALTGGEINATGTPNTVYVSYNATQANFHLVNPPIQSPSGSSSPLCGANGLTIANNSGTPDTLIDVAALQALTQNNAGLVLNRSSVSFSINLSTGNVTSTANGMDGEAIGTNQWIYIWLIDNGSAIAGLGSTSSTSPTLPSGYTYKCRAGAMRVDGASHLLKTKQAGSWAQYTSPPGPILISGASGSVTVPTWTAASVSATVPATATIIRVTLTGSPGNNQGMMAAPNNSYGGAGSSGNPPPISFLNSAGAGGLAMTIDANMTLESTNVYYASTMASGALVASGWKDSVNAN